MIDGNSAPLKPQCESMSMCLKLARGCAKQMITQLQATHLQRHHNPFLIFTQMPGTGWPRMQPGEELGSRVT